MKHLNNQIKDAFSEIHADENLKQHAEIYLKQKIRDKKSIFKTRVSYAVSFGMVLIISVIAISFYFTPVTAISVDVNPSVEIDINRFDRVISVTGIGDAGQDIVSSVNVMHMSYTDALDAIIASEKLKNYYSENELIEIAVISEDEDKSSDILQSIGECHFNLEHNVYSHSVDNEVKKQALEYDLSFGKYSAYLELQELSPEVTVDDIRYMSMSGIRELIKQYSSDDSDEDSSEQSSDSESQGSGNGQGQGDNGQGQGQGGNGQGHGQNN